VVCHDREKSVESTAMATPRVDSSVTGSINMPSIVQRSRVGVPASRQTFLGLASADMLSDAGPLDCALCERFRELQSDQSRAPGPVPVARARAAAWPLSASGACHISTQPCAFGVARGGSIAGGRDPADPIAVCTEGRALVFEGTGHRATTRCTAKTPGHAIILGVGRRRRRSGVKLGPNSISWKHRLPLPNSGNKSLIDNEASFLKL